jgi:hypothetical protein
MSGTFFVYILASRKLGTLYIGYTSDLARRLHEHREEGMPGFTSKYGVKRLVHYEVFDYPRIVQTGTVAEALAAGLENKPDRARQSRLAGPVRPS